MYFAKLEPGAQTMRYGYNPYRDHKNLWTLFDPDPGADRDFLFRRDLIGGRPRYYVVAERPLCIEDHPQWHIRQKPYAPDLRAGDRLYFQMRVNPIVCRDGKKLDVVMDARKRLGPDWARKTTKPALIDEAGRAWLTKRADRHGFAVAERGIRFEGYRPLRFTKHAGARPIHISVLDIEGLLEVRDPDAFSRALYRGIGPAKAFGCGLILVRRP